MAEERKRTTRYLGLKEGQRLQKKRPAPFPPVNWAEKFGGLKEHERLQKQKEAEAKKKAKRAKKAAKAKADAEAAKKARQPFNPGRSGIRMPIPEAEEVEFNPKFPRRRPALYTEGNAPPPSVSKRGKYTGPITTAEDFKLIGGAKKLKKMKPRKM
tara:strand:+ start:383 stop:850 length:468 start_codon:yes stop_codon:yes gene_type:complete